MSQNGTQRNSRRRSKIEQMRLTRSLMAPKDAARDQNRLKNRFCTIAARRKSIVTRILWSQPLRKSECPFSAKPIQEKCTTRTWQTQRTSPIPNTSGYIRTLAFKDMNPKSESCFSQKKTAQERTDC